MKRAVISMVAVMAAAVTFGAQNDLLISFSTKGPDTYADGTLVLDGECYALVWTPKSVETAEIAADGSAEDGAQIVLTAPVATNGHCPNVVYRVDAKRVESEFQTSAGSWSVYLLDTRRYAYDKDGNSVATVAGITDDGKVRLVNAFNRVGEAKVSAGAGANTSLKSDAATVAATGATVPADTPEPLVTGIEIWGGNVYVTVRNAAPYLAYDLVTGASVDAVNANANNPANGDDDGKVILVAPADESGAGFFKVRAK